MKTTMVRTTLATLVATMVAAPMALAEDIDLYGGIPGGGNKPNVLLILDNAAAWDAASTYSQTTCPVQNNGSGIVTPNNAGKDVGFEQCALYKAIEAIGNEPALNGKLNIGLMMFGSSQLGGSWGGIMRTPSAQPYNLPTITGPSSDTSSTLYQFLAYLKSIDRQTDNVNSSQVGGAMYEAYSFFTGRTSNASGIAYTSHLQLACQRNFIIYIANALNNGKPQDQGQNAQNELNTATQTYSGTTPVTQINTSYIDQYTKYDSQWGDEWARFLYGTDLATNVDDKQNIITYTIAVTDGANPDYVQHAQSMANAGGGKSFVVTVGDVSGLVQALLKIFNEVSATNSVFASSSLPVSANTQGTYLNQIYIGMFRPDGNASPRWLGNLKQYQFGVGGNAANPTLFLADSTLQPALTSAGKGFISPNAISFWNPAIDTSVLPDKIGGFWVNQPQGAGGGFDRPDGELVEKGGVGQQIRLANLTDNYTTNPSTPRNLFTCTTGCGAGSNLSGTPFATTNTAITATALGVSNPVYQIGVNSITRNSSTGVVTVNLATTPTPGISDPTTVTIAGSLNGQYNFNLAGKSPAASGSTVTFTLPAENPPIPPVGTYTATGAAAGTSNITSLTRNSDVGYFVATGVFADPTFGGGAAVAIGDVVNISNSVGANYDGSATILTTSGSTVTFRAQETPVIAGTATKLTNSNGNDTGALTTTRGTSCSGCSTNSGKVLLVSFPGGTTKLSPNKGAPGLGTTVTVSGATPASYNGSWQLVGMGASCSVQYKDAAGATQTVTGTANGATNNGTAIVYTVCLDLGASFAVAPSTAGSGAQSSPQTIGSRQNPGVTRTISAWSIATASNCPTTPNETVQATTSIPHGFSNGESVTIASANPGLNEGALSGANKTITVTGTSTFTYQVATTPTCSDNTSGMSITYQNSAGGVDVNSLINWVRGEDNVGDEQSPGNGINIRPSVHGDVLHSRPVVVNYGGSTGVVVFYGANDGVFRAINGNQSAAIGSTPSGGEMWGFIAPEFFPKLQRQYQNSPIIKLATTPTGIVPTPTPKDYFFDGSTGLYQDSTTVTLFLTARRGGRFIYALNVNNPSTPKFLWKKSNNDAGMGELGYTWSLPKAARVRGYANPVVIMGAGYDPAEDEEPAASSTARSMGRGIFILDATDGSLVWSAKGGGASNVCTGNPCALQDMTFAIPADLTLVNRDFDTNGYIDRIYAADVGGNIWRVDLEPAGYAASAGSVGPSSWKVSLFASVGGTGTIPRKFFYPPDVVGTKYGDMVLAATGDREHPIYSASGTSSYAVVNRFYGLKDPNIGADAGTSPTVLYDTSSTTSAPATITSPTSLVNAATNQFTINSTDSGFYLSLTNPGEKGVNAPVTIGGYTYFGTNEPPTPSTPACTDLGTARGYRVSFLTGQAAFTLFDGGGLPPSPVAGLVNVNVNGSPRSLPFCLGCGNPDGAGPDSKSPLGGIKPPIPVNPIRKRVYWYIEKHDT